MLRQDVSSDSNGIRIGSGSSKNSMGNGNERVPQSAISVSVNTVLANELNKLSFHERESINEEIHGIDVRNIEELGSAEETSEILRKSFHDLDTEIKQLCSTYGNVGEMAYAFNRSQKLFGSIPEKGTYLNTNKIRIMFIRCERFDCKKAAVRICRFAEEMYDLYGDVGLERNAKLSDLNDDEMVKLKQGCCQILSGRDRAGRRIYMHYFSETWKFLTIRSRRRIASYVAMDLLVNDVVSQRRGNVVIMWIGAEYEMDAKEFITRGSSLSRSSESLPLRIGATHFCFPSQKISKKEAVVHMIIGIASQIKPHLRIHFGPPVECFYTLASFGITISQIPINLSSSELDLTNHNRWLDLCIAREKNPEFHKLIIECPNNTDILFGRGHTYMNHPGNIMFRNFIRSNLEAYSNTQSKKETTQWTLAAVHALKTEYGARFLKEEQINSTTKAWVEVPDSLARRKLRVSFRDAKSRLANRKEKETTDTNNQSLQLKSSLLSLHDNSEETALDDTFSSSSPLYKGKGIGMQIPNDVFSLSALRQQREEQLKIEVAQDLNSNIVTLNSTLGNLNSNLNSLMNPQNSDSSTCTFMGLDGSSNAKRQRRCSHDFFDCF